MGLILQQHCTFTATMHATKIPYSGKLLREKIGEKYNFCRLLAFAVPKDITPPNFMEKTFTKPQNSRNFSPSKVSRYTVHNAIVFDYYMGPSRIVHLHTIQYVFKVRNSKFLAKNLGLALCG